MLWLVSDCEEFVHDCICDYQFHQIINNNKKRLNADYQQYQIISAGTTSFVTPNLFCWKLCHAKMLWHTQTVAFLVSIQDCSVERYNMHGFLWHTHIRFFFLLTFQYHFVETKMTCPNTTAHIHYGVYCKLSRFCQFLLKVSTGVHDLCRTLWHT